MDAKAWSPFLKELRSNSKYVLTYLGSRNFFLSDFIEDHEGGLKKKLMGIFMNEIDNRSDAGGNSDDNPGIFIPSSIEAG